MSNPFVLETDAYAREIDPIGQAVEQYAFYLHKNTGDPLEQCRAFVISTLQPGGKFEFKDPKIKYLERNEFGDRELKDGTLREYIYTSLSNRELIAPTFTTYKHHDVEESYLVSFIQGNVKKRSVAKKAMFKYKNEGNTLMFVIKDNEQNNRKIKNNSISGAHVSPSTPLYNPTGHSTLTSNCRSTSGFGNANNEKLLTGNRHYWCPEVVRANINSIIMNSDISSVIEVVEKYGLVYPSVEQTMECITYSTNLYWRDRYQTEKLHNFVSTLTPADRAAFVYTGDLYHVMKYNEAFMREFVTSMSARGEPYAGDFNEVIKNATNEDYSHAVQICPDLTRGIKKEDLPDSVRRVVAGTILNIQQTVGRYTDFIVTFLTTPNVPASLARLPDSIRRCALTSDTDSTIFTVQDWVKWHQGFYGFTPECQAVSSTMIYMAAQTIVHILARMAANFGVPNRLIRTISMKNEYKFDVFVPTQVAKHYFAYIGCREGNLYAEYEKEIKGVNLRSSVVAKALVKDSHRLMTEIMDTVVAGNKIKLIPILKHVGDLEREILSAMKEGDPKYFKRANVKALDSYSRKEKEPVYLSYTLWNEVFAPKYGEIPPPPYTAIRLSCHTAKPAATREWIAEMKDRELAKRMEDWLARNNKPYIGTMLVPETIAASIGIPEEMLDAVGSRKLIRDGLRSHYLVLECLGVYLENKKITKLVSDYY